MLVIVLVVTKIAPARKAHNEDDSVETMHSTEQMIISCQEDKTQFHHIFSSSEHHCNLFYVTKQANQLQVCANVQMLFIHRTPTPQ